MRPLPNGGQSFTTIRKKDYLYVDKTKYIYDIVKESGCAFLARPRRFGKSLLIGTMRSLLLGNRKYFKGLWIDSSDYDFKKYPVVRLSLTGSCNTTKALKGNIATKLRVIAKDNNIGQYCLAKV